MERLDLSAGNLEQLLRHGVGYTLQPWFLFELAVVFGLFVVSRLLGARVMPALERRARAIKGRPGLLRVVVALLRRTQWIIFVALLFLALTLLRTTAPPGEVWPVSLALALASAWLVVAVLARIIRNRLAARVVTWLVWVYAALIILGVDDRAAALLDGFAIPLGTVRFSALLFVKAAVVLTVAIWIAILIGNFLEEQLQRSGELTPSMRVLLGKILKIGLVFIAGAIALSAAGVDLTAFTVFSGAVGVGIGFGLQKVVSNFISGMIILLDKSIKPGDTISVGQTFGWIRELRARFVSVVTRDGREYLIPNEDLITQQVINWSFSDELVRLDVTFGVSYESDPHKVTKLAIAAATTVARVESDRRPVCWMTGFGDSSIDFVLRFWIHDPQQGLTNVRGKVLLALWDTFKENGIAVPYPHRELIMKKRAGDDTADARSHPVRD